MKPKKTLVATKEVDHDSYFTKRVFCPKCGQNLGSYTYGRPWCTGGIAFNQRPERCDCGLYLDWTKIPYPTGNVAPVERKPKWKK